MISIIYDVLKNCTIQRKLAWIWTTTRSLGQKKMSLNYVFTVHFLIFVLPKEDESFAFI